MTSNSFVKRLRRDESGQTLVLAAIMLPVLIGFVGFAVDVGYAFDYKKQMQLAADSAAMAGAIAVKANGSINSTELALVVTMDTAANGFTNGSGGIAVTVCRPAVDLTCPTTYTYTAPDGAVKVSISQAKDTFFTKIINFNSLTIGASAVAAKSAASGLTSNIVILDTNCETGFSVTGGSSTVTVGGSIYVNACGSTAVSLSGGSSSITAGQGIYIGCNSASPPTCGGTTNPNITPVSTGNPQIADPLAGLPEPVPDGTEPVHNTNVSISSGTLDPGVYNAGLRIEGGSVTLNQGIYFINGGQLRISGSGTTVLGSGVMFYLYNGATFSSTGGPTVNMSAPTSGTYKGIWFFQQRSNTNSVAMTGGIILNIDGVIYISNPATTLTYTGSPSFGSLADYTVFVVWKLVMTGGTTVLNSDFSAIGGSPLTGGVSGLALAE